MSTFFLYNPYALCIWPGDSESLKIPDSSSERTTVESKGLRFFLGDIKIKNDVEEAVVPQICPSLISRHIWTEPTLWHNSELNGNLKYLWVMNFI